MLQPALATLSDPIRRRILELLREQPRTAGDIAARFSVTWPAISRHLRLLKEAGLIAERRTRRQRIYTLRPDALLPVLDWVSTLAGTSGIPPASPPAPPIVTMGRQDFS